MIYGYSDFTTHSCIVYYSHFCPSSHINGVIGRSFPLQFPAVLPGASPTVVQLLAAAVRVSNVARRISVSKTYIIPSTSIGNYQKYKMNNLLCLMDPRNVNCGFPNAIPRFFGIAVSY